MAEERKKEGEETAISCSICLKEISHEEGETYEVDDYVHHFCGLECYSEWQRRKDEDAPKDSKG